MKLEEIRKRFMEAESEPEPEPAPASPRPEVKTDTRLITPNGHGILAMENNNGVLLMAQENIQDLTQREVEAWVTTIVKRFVPEVADARAVSRDAVHQSMGPVSVKITVEWHATDRDLEITDTELECNEDNTYFLLPTVNRRVGINGKCEACGLGSGGKELLVRGKLDGVGPILMCLKCLKYVKDKWVAQP